MPIDLPSATPSNGTAAFTDAVRRRLGGGDADDVTSGVDVELTDADYAHCLKTTLVLLNRNRPRVNRAILAGAVATVQRYPISQPGLLDVLDVSFVMTTPPVSSQVPDVFDPLFNGAAGVQNATGTGPGTASDYLRYEMAYDDAMIVFGQTPDWTSEREVASDGTETLVLFVWLPQGVSYQVGYEYTWGITPDDDPRTGVARIEPVVRDWVYDYGAALAKEIVGRKRSKYGGVVTADDGTSETDGAALVSEGREERQALEEKLKTLRRAVRPHVG